VLRRAAALCLCLLFAAMTAAPALAEPIVCPPGTVPDPNGGQCVITVLVPGTGGGNGGKGAGDPAEPAAQRTCTFTLLGSSREMPCSSDDGWWSQSQQAYCEAASPQPPLSDPVWGGRTEGQIYECTRPGAAFGVVAPVFLIWLAQPPAGAPPDPRVLAQQAIATMNLKAVSIGIVPEPAPGRVGLVGMPVWMWDTNPGPTTWGPITKTASAGGYTVTATAKATKVVWSMGDGEVVVCRTPGTPYEDSYGRQDSPDCGYTYTRQGVYQVWARSYWSVEWSGLGQSGSIPLQFANSVRITVGEAQVLTQ
jgi:hypothetical protein